jgi:hypothetical protein
MSKAWKWILGILGVLIVVGLLAGAGFMWKSRAYFISSNAYAPRYFDQPASPDGPGTPRGYEQYRRYHMDEWGGRMPMMSYGYYHAPYAFGPMGLGYLPFAGPLHLLFPLGVLALVAYIFYQLGKRAGIAAAATAQPASQPTVESPPRRRVAKR